MTLIDRKRTPPVVTPRTSKQESPEKPAAAAPAARGWAPASAKAATVAASGAAAAATRAAEAFYGAFASRDLAAMGRCYAPDVQFHDPLFKSLRGPEVMDMWKTIMPAANPATFKIEPRVASPTANADGSWTVKVHWDAHYDLGSRHIDNHSDSTLVVRDGKIVSQRDDWDLGAWTKQALPFGGGTRAANAVASLAAHSFIELQALFEKLKER